MEENLENKKPDIKEAVSLLLSARHITKVIYVDEKFDSRGYVENFKGFVRANHLIETLPFADEDSEIAIRKFIQWWNDLEESARINWIQKLGIQHTATRTEQRLSDIFDKGILTFASPNEFESMDLKNGFNESNQILVLMDQELEGYGKGFDYLKKYVNQDYIQCGLFSGKFDKEEEIGKWKDLCDYSYFIYPISKKRVTNDDSSDIVEGLRNVLWLRQISDIKKQYSTTISNAIKETTSYIDQIDPASFDNIVMTKSETEGCWEFDTLHRIGLATLNKKVEECVLKDDSYNSFQTSTTSLRSIKAIVSKNIPKGDTQMAHDIIRIEKYKDGDYINQTYSQLCNGDIFIIGDKHFMLLCQPCNLEIRKNGKRKAGELLHIVPMFEQTKSLEKARKELEDFQKEKEELYRERKYEELANKAHDYNFKKAIPDDNNIENQYNSIIKYNDSFYLLRYNEAIMVDAWALDLVSYNQDGKSNLNIDKKVLQRYIMPNMQLRHNAIMDSLNKEDKLEDCKPYGFNGKCIKELSICRIGRLKDPWAQEYLQEFMAYLSRPAYPMELE